MITPELGKEYPEAHEAADIQIIIDSIINRLKRDYPPGKTLKQFHAKMHGCLKATFTVVADLPSRFQYGFLVPGKSYEAWIRLSNGSVKVRDDRKADLRGIAIKLLNVPGEMFINDDQLPQSQDFLLVSYPTLMSPDVAGFKKNIKALCNGTMALVLFVLNPANWPAIVRTVQSMKKCDSVLTLQYWSVSPSRLGKAEQVVKYSAIPVVKEPLQVKKDTNFLRQQIKSQLDIAPVRFDFMIQLQEDAVTMPIENVCVEWKSAWTKVATIEIGTQQFDTPERNDLGERMSFSPWHCLKDHQPLGGISRARKAAYLAISKFRLERNKK